MIGWASLMPRWRDPGSPAPLRLREWVDEAACARVGGDWFPDPRRRVDVSLEKAICGGCPVRTECLAYALDAGEPFGIWGGLTTDERLILIARLTAIAAAAAGDPSPSRAA
jgi:WhiB family redox-sensing transcriptional regulator